MEESGERAEEADEWCCKKEGSGGGWENGEERSFFVQIFSHFIPEQMRSRRMLSILYLHFELELSV